MSQQSTDWIPESIREQSWEDYALSQGLTRGDIYAYSSGEIDNRLMQGVDNGALDKEVYEEIQAHSLKHWKIEDAKAKARQFFNNAFTQMEENYKSELKKLEKVVSIKEEF